MVLGGVAAALVGGVALDDRSADMVDDGLPEFRAEEVLIADLAGVYLDGDIAGELLSGQLDEFYYLFGTLTVVLSSKRFFNVSIAAIKFLAIFVVFRV